MNFVLRLIPCLPNSFKHQVIDELMNTQGKLVIPADKVEQICWARLVVLLQFSSELSQRANFQGSVSTSKVIGFCSEELQFFPSS